ncbi:MAG: helix-turn-helix transcriptional regulator [Flammeovirgaceae bacterium]|nr:MAG: helix-turn-helix transcriptional regulator [Flammeovirgaceae bacterium]
MKHFHQFIKEKRMEKEVSLRQFCREAELDPSNWSKVERGLADPPRSAEILDRIANVLNFNEEEIVTMKDLALIDSIPQDLRPQENVLEKLPIFFRTVRGEKPNEEELKKLIKTIIES